MKILSSKVFGEILPVVFGAGFIAGSLGEVQAMKTPLNFLTSSYQGKLNLERLDVKNDGDSSSVTSNESNDSVQSSDSGEIPEVSPKKKKEKEKFQSSRRRSSLNEDAQKRASTREWIDQGLFSPIKKSLKNWDDPDMTDDLGVTNLMEAVKSRKINIVRLFLEYGGSVDEQDLKGNTALLLAIYDRINGYPSNDIISALVAFKADVHLPDESGNSPYKVAKQSGLSDVLSIFYNSPTFSFTKAHEDEDSE